MSKSEIRRSASSFGVIMLIIVLLGLSWSSIWQSSKAVSTKLIEQTAISGAFSKAGTAVIVLGEDADILYWDDSAVRLFGFTNEEVIKKSVDMIVPHDEEHGNHIQQSLAENNPAVKIITCEGSTKAGEIIPLTLRVYSPFQGDKVLVLADELKPDTLTKR